MDPQPNGTPGAAPPGTGNAPDNAEPQIDVQALARIVNAAVTDQLKRHLPKAIEAAMPSLVEQIAAKVQPQAPKADDDAGKSRPSPELAAMERRLADMQTKLEKAESDRLSAENKRRDDKTKADLRQQLVDAKVRPELVNAFLAQLYYEGRVEFDDDGNPLLKVPVSPGRGLPEQEQALPLAEGVKAILKHSSALPFLPAPGGAPASGTATRQTQTIPRPIAQTTQQVFKSDAQSEEEAARAALEFMTARGIPVPGVG